MSGVIGTPNPDRAPRADAAYEHRRHAGSRAGERGAVRTNANDEEVAYGDTFAANYHKSLPHDADGFVDPDAYRDFVEALLSQDHRRFEGVLAGDNFPEGTHPRRTTGTEGRRKLTSPFTGHAFDLQGADAGALSVDAAPRLGSDEFAAELAEVYGMALLRDESFEDLQAGTPASTMVTDALRSMSWFDGNTAGIPSGAGRMLGGPDTLFRGSTPGSQAGPWLSQFMLVGNRGPDTGPSKPSVCKRTAIEVDDGYVFYGSAFIDQRSAVAEAGVDWLQTWASWLDAQNGADFNGKDQFQPERRFLTTPRDVATYVHFDALYQAYQVACNLMLAGGAPFGFDRGMPETLSRTRSAFASFGGAHVLSLVAEVATRALKLVWRQKWLHHRRLRPEVAAALLTLYANDPARIPNDALRSALAELHSKMPADLLSAIAAKNAEPDAQDRITSNGNTADLPVIDDAKNYLLPMAFPEGSPTHPSYGAGHATVAGACVTVLKAFFEMYDERGDELPWPLDAGDGPGGSGAYGFNHAYVGNGSTIRRAPGSHDLTLQGELDKLAANISIARNMAGVHYYTDYFASVRQGERLTASILEEQLACFNEPVSMSFTSFDGDRIRVRGHGLSSEVSVIDRHGHPIGADAWYQRYGG
ncbi:MAG: vanadium-dependent haloperoxidase [Bacteroidota bacterium]